jgi:acyl-coenzyme A synthetase/AMP-(fatty) acid ligase
MGDSTSGHLLTHPSIVDAAVVGVPDDYSGELPMAFIVLQPELAAAADTNARLADELRMTIFKVWFASRVFG